MIEIEKLFKRVQRVVKTVAVTCLQWGDSGKGKLVDILAKWADIIIRGTGGPNAGHTLVVNGKKLITHTIPSGILYDGEGKINIIGTGVVLDLRILCEEINEVAKMGIECKNLKISMDAKLILPVHIVLDRMREMTKKKKKIGTTGRGIGPVYADHVSRIGLVMNDLLNEKLFREKLKANLEIHLRTLRQYDRNDLYRVMHCAHLENGKYYDHEEIFNLAAIVNSYMSYAKRIKGMIEDTDAFVRSVVGKKNILLEGAQGGLLDIDYGTYPYVTSSNTTVVGLAKGCGLSEEDVDINFGIVKAPYMTRVGEGAFPTEMDEKGKNSANAKGPELKFSSHCSVNSSDIVNQGIAVRISGDEYGATTGRPRRVGWLDLVLLKDVLKHSGKRTTLVITKPDVLNECEVINICIAYKYEGPDYQHGQRLLRKGDIINDAILEDIVLRNCIPVYQKFDGWLSDISEIRNFEEIPKNLIKILSFIEKESKTSIGIVSVGPDREETIII